jgi:hypothetical protein
MAPINTVTSPALVKDGEDRPANCDPKLYLAGFLVSFFGLRFSFVDLCSLPMNRILSLELRGQICTCSQAFARGAMTATLAWRRGGLRAGGRHSLTP